MTEALSEIANEHPECRSTRDLIFMIVQAVVHEKDRVSLTVEEEGDSILLIVFVAPDDLGRLLGPEGRTVRSIRTILSAVSMKQQRRYALDIRAIGTPHIVPYS